MLIMFTFILVAIVAGGAGGALSGLKLAASDLGVELAAMMGAFYGLSAALPAAVLAGVFFTFMH